VTIESGGAHGGVRRTAGGLSSARESRAPNITEPAQSVQRARYAGKYAAMLEDLDAVRGVMSMPSVLTAELGLQHACTLSVKESSC
jgi:hypothetical protein